MGSFLAQTKAKKVPVGNNALSSESLCFQMGFFPLQQFARNSYPCATHFAARTCGAFDGDFKGRETG